MKKQPINYEWKIPFVIAGAVILLNSCVSNKKDFAVKGNVQIINNCGGQIPDTIVVKISFLDDQKSQIDTDTAWVIIKDGFYPFKKTSNVNEDAVKCRISDVKDINGKLICTAARNHTCKSPMTCKGAFSNNQVVTIGELMMYDVTCSCAN